jgi:glutaredoxin
MFSTTIIRVVLVSALAAACGAQAQTNVYRWVDKDGKVQFSDSPPPADAKNVTQKRIAVGSDDDSLLPYGLQVAMKRNPITMYTATDCGSACGRARDLLAKRGIPFAEKNAQTNAADAEALKKIAGSLDVPFLLIGSSQLKGYEEDTWNAALDSAGYPRTRLPGAAVQAPAPAAAPAASAPQGSPPPAK